MATRSLATRMWTPAASSLCRHPGPRTPPLRSRLVDTIHTQAGHQRSGIPKPAADNVSLRIEMYKAARALREHSLELDEIHAEMRSIMKRCVAAVVGLPLLVNRKSDPPVCKIMDFHKEKYKKETHLKERLKTKCPHYIESCSMGSMDEGDAVFVAGAELNLDLMDLEGAGAASPDSSGSADEIQS